MSRQTAERDKAYLVWIRGLRCLVCAGRGRAQLTITEAHHAGPHPFGRKAPDRHAVPLCCAHHRVGPEAVHTLGRKFWDAHKIDMHETIARLNAEYEAAISLPPAA